MPALSDRHYFVLKKLHSLSGVIPVGVFLLEHFYTNAYATKGAAVYNEKVADLTGLPYLFAIELFGIFLPIAFHGILGAYIAVKAKHNVGTHPTGRNWMFVLQRVTGVFLLFYIGLHVYHTRFSSANEDLFALMQQHLSNPFMFAFYVLGVTAASFHLGNGLWGFAVSWGITVTPHAQKQMHRFAMAVFVLLTLVGVNSLLAFQGKAFTALQRPPEAHAEGPPVATEIRVQFPEDRPTTTPPGLPATAPMSQPAP